MFHTELLKLTTYIRPDDNLEKASAKFAEQVIMDDATSHQDRFWIRAERLLVQSVAIYIMTALSEENLTLGVLGALVEKGTVVQEGQELTELDLRFRELEKHDPDNTACRYYSLYQKTAYVENYGIAVSAAIQIKDFINNLYPDKIIRTADEAES